MAPTGLVRQSRQRPQHTFPALPPTAGSWVLGQGERGGISRTLLPSPLSSHLFKIRLHSVTRGVVFAFVVWAAEGGGGEWVGGSRAGVVE